MRHFSQVSWELLGTSKKGWKVFNEYAAESFHHYPKTYCWSKLTSAREVTRSHAVEGKSSRESFKVYEYLIVSILKGPDSVLCQRFCHWHARNFQQPELSPQPRLPHTTPRHHDPEHVRSTPLDPTSSPTSSRSKGLRESSSLHRSNDFPTHPTCTNHKTTFRK